jgi:hypothetical protein
VPGLPQTRPSRDTREFHAQDLPQQPQYLSWILWGFIGIFVLYIFADFAAAPLGHGQGGSTYAAKVGDQTVSLAEFKTANQALESQYRPDVRARRFHRQAAKAMRTPDQWRSTRG